MADFDLIVVGAGPAGSNAAAVALRAGLRVVQIDAAKFPRVKPCAGGVTIKAARSLQLTLAPCLRRSFDAIEFNLWKQRTNRFVHGGRVLHMVSRPEFDNHLVQQNLSHGNFEFLDGQCVKSVSYDRRFTVVTDRVRVSAAQVIGADGAYSIVNRIFGIAAPRQLATAVEVNVERSSGNTSSCDVPCLDYGAIERGYGWVFPKDDHCCVGLYTLAPKTRDIRGQLLAYLRSKGFRDVRASSTDFRAARIPVGGHRPRVPDCPVYVTGDAGGFADALTGEGIYAALESGRIAGDVAVDVAFGRADHRAYYRRLWRPVLLDTAATFHASRHFYGNVDRGIRILQSPLVWRPLIQGGAAASTFCGCFMKSAFYLPRSLAGGSAAHRAVWAPDQPLPA